MSNVSQYSYLTQKIIPLNPRDEWYKRANLMSPIPTLYKNSKSDLIKSPVTVYTKEGCPYCIRAIELLKKHNIRYEKFDRSDNENLVNKLTNNYKYVPVIIDGNGKFIGGYKELQKILN